MKTPGPDHPIAIERAARRWRATFAGQVIADSGDALILREASYPPRVYFPRADVSMDELSRTEAGTHCPYKGDAAYYTVRSGGQVAENAVWTYETPYPAMAEIAGRLSFYPDRIEIAEVADAAAADEDFAITVDDVVQHTDSGSGASQKDHWASNVSQPKG